MGILLTSRITRITKTYLKLHEVLTVFLKRSFDSEWGGLNPKKFLTTKENLQNPWDGGVECIVYYNLDLYVIFPHHF